MGKAILYILFVVEVVKYYLAYKVIFRERLRQYLVPAMGALIYLAALLMFRDGNQLLMAVLVYFHVLCIIFIVQQATLLDRLLVLLFFLSCADTFFEKLMDIFTEQNIKDIGWGSLVQSLLTLVVLLALYVVQKNSAERKECRQNKLEKPIILTVALMALEIVVAIAILDYVDIHIDNLKIKTIATIICLFAYLSIGVLGIFIFYIRQVNKNMEKLLENEMLLQDMQRQYYESLLKKEEDTRRYRHDMSNHLLCLNRLVEEDDLMALKEYLGEMRQELQEIQKNEYDSGNRIINVITNHYIKDLSSMANIKITGRIQIQLDEMKLCTIYANLIQNAVEELKRCEGSSQLEIQFEQGRQYCRISICNSLSTKSQEKTEKQLLETEKQDSKNHGLGVSNIENAVNALHGTLELTRKENCFLAVVVLPLQ
ncbi:MAG: GHKL domain-containing protein [Acetatifactor sp.]|nr:GHKL domain-containing protein [Acetatifactor sp.]